MNLKNTDSKTKIVLAVNLIAIMISSYKLFIFGPYTDIGTFFIIRLYSGFHYIGILIAYALISGILFFQNTKKQADLKSMLLSFIVLIGVLGSISVFLV